MNPFLAQEEAARVQYANASGRSQYNAMMVDPSSSMSRPAAADGDNAILAALAKIQAAVTDIAVKQDNISQRLTHLEVARASENLANGALAVDSERGGQSATRPTTIATDPDSMPTTDNPRGTKRKVDGSNHDGARRVRAPGNTSNNDLSALGNRPRSEGEGSNAMRLVTFYNESHRPENQQRQAPGVQDYRGLDDGAEASASERLPAPDQTKIMTEVRRDFIHVPHSCSISQSFLRWSTGYIHSQLMPEPSIVTGSSSTRPGLQM